jgi:hypothetical protein
MFVPGFIVLLAILASSGATAGGRPVIELFSAVPDCIFPNSRLAVASYRVSGGIRRIRVEALHQDGRVRVVSQDTFRTPIPGASGGVVDRDATSDVEGYRIVAIGEGIAVSRQLEFRYRRARFELAGPAFHTLLTAGSGRTALYQAQARLLSVDSLSCSFALSRVLGLEVRRPGTTEIGTDRASREPVVRCFVTWPRVADALAGGTVEWTARVRDRCTQGRIKQEARVNPIR